MGHIGLGDIRGLIIGHKIEVKKQFIEVGLRSLRRLGLVVDEVSVLIGVFDGLLELI